MVDINCHYFFASRGIYNKKYYPQLLWSNNLIRPHVAVNSNIAIYYLDIDEMQGFLLL